MKHARLALLLTATTLLAACSGSQKASDSNFKKAISAYNQSHPLCLPISPATDDMSGGVIGQETVRIVRTDAAGKPTNKNALKQMGILDKEGVYDQQKDEEADGYKSYYAVFTLTDKGKKYFVGPANNPHLCIGTTRVKKINWFSLPTGDNGLTVSHVSYRGQHDLHKWAKKLLQAGNPEVIDSLDEEINMQSTLVLTNKGWLDSRELN